MKRAYHLIIAFVAALTVQPLWAQQTADEGLSFSLTDENGDFGYWGKKGKKETFDLAIRINKPELVGAKVNSINVILPETNNLSGFKVWMSRALTLDTKKQNVPDVCEQEADIRKAFKGEYVQFSEPYTITSEGVYVGYSFTIDGYDEHTANPILLGYTTQPDGFWVHSSKSYLKWMDNSSFGNLAIEVKLTGLPKHGVAAKLDTTLYVVTGKQSTVPVRLVNCGMNPVTSIDYTFSVNGTDQPAHIDLTEPLKARYGASCSTTVNVPALPADGTYPATLTINKVNGVAATYPGTSITSTADARAYIPVHRTLMEEYTGTWCGNCPRGWAAIEAMHRLHPDEFVCLSYHYKDPMQTMDSGNFPNANVAGYPMASIERGDLIDPYYGSATEVIPFGINNVWQTAQSKAALAGIDVQGTFVNDSTVEATVEFKSPRPLTNAQYAVEVVLAADSIAGTGKKWQQENYLKSEDSKNYPEPEFAPFFTTEPVFVPYNDVALTTTRLQGTDISLPATIEAYKPYTGKVQLNAFTRSLSIIDDSGNSSKTSVVMQNSGKLKVVALIIDKRTKRVVNAAQARVDASHTSISRITAGTSTTAQPATYYDLGGRRVQLPRHGVFITNTGKKVVR